MEFSLFSRGNARRNGAGALRLTGMTEMASPRERDQRTVLTVDDSASILEAIEVMLREAGYHVIAASDGRKALDIAAAQNPDLIITDLHMPAMDGLTLMREVRKLPGCRYIPIIILTTDASPTHKSEARAAGASAWMSKPFNADKLLNVVRKVLR